MMYGGSKGGGKSVFGCFAVYFFCKWVIEEFNLPKTKYPIPIAFMGRKRGTDFNDTTLETWKKFIPANTYYIRTQDKEIIIDDKVKIIYGGLDDSKTVRKFNSAEFAFVFLDQAEEIERDLITELRLTLRLKINNRQLPYKILFTANPAICFLKDEFVTSCGINKVYLPALPSDNEMLAKGYVERIRQATAHRPELLQAYLYGNWNALEGSNMVFKNEWLEKSSGLNLHLPSRRVISTDVARFGDDSTVIQLIDNAELVKKISFGQRDEEYIANRIAIETKSFKPKMIIVDCAGVGAGVATILRRFEIPTTNDGDSVPIFEFFGANRKDVQDRNRFWNLRAESYWTVAQMFAKGELEVHNFYPDLVKQLLSTSYHFSGDRILIDSKEEIKKILSRSPDDADCYIMGVWAAMNFVEPDKTVNDDFDSWLDGLGVSDELDPMCM